MNENDDVSSNNEDDNNKQINSKKKKPKRATAIASVGTTIEAKTCNHDKNVEFNASGDRKYFTEAYYANRPTCTQKCFQCEGVFGVSIKVNDKSPAYCCVNRFDKNNPCNHAYCHDCWIKHRS
jgi:hypothetical protein